jgi:SAM-dependent methyltransferase
MVARTPSQRCLKEYGVTEEPKAGRQDSEWQTQSLSQTYLNGVRGAIPGAQTQIEIIRKIVELWRPAPCAVIDLGCGDGILGRTVLERWPGAHVWFVDFSEPMLRAAQGRVGQNPSATIVQADFSIPGWIGCLDGRTSFDLVLSGYAIHHQPDQTKKRLYAEVYDLLSPGGVFLNLEHVASATARGQELFDETFIDNLYQFHLNLGTSKSRTEIAREYYARPDKKENILAPVEVQCAWLREIGFEDVDCFYRFFELALFGGRKQQ